MEEAFETYITDDDKMAFKIKMLKLKILGVLLDAEYKNDDDKYDNLDPKNYPKITSDLFNKYMNELINGDGKYADADADDKLASNIKTLRLIEVINFISAGFEDKLKATLNIKYTLPQNPPKDKKALYIFQLKLIIGYYDDALSSLSGEFTTTGKGVFTFLKNTAWFNSLATRKLSMTDDEQRYRYAILKRYMSIVRKYDEIMLKEISNGGAVIDSKILEGREKFKIAFENLKINSDTTIKALELLEAYNKKVEAAYALIKKADETGNLSVGGKPTKYKYVPTGDVVYILYNKKRIKRNIYVKDKGRPTKYCKINKEYVLLSKLR
jgi:hypothetical protein